MLTVSQLINDLLNETLLGTYRAHFNVLANPTDALNTSTLLTVVHPLSGIGEGSYLEVGQELMYLVPGGLNQTARTVVVIRAVRGTTIAAHAAGDGVSINPRFARSTILGAFQEELRSWPISLFRVDQLDTTTNADVTSIDLAALSGVTDIIRPVKVWRRATSPDKDRWIPLDGWRFERDLFSDGSADLYLSGFYQTGSEFRILVARPFADPEVWTETTTLADAGVPESCADILKYGAAWRLLMGREVRRNFTEIESEGRNTQEVPPSANLQIGRQLKLLRDGRLAEEITRLRSLYGVYAR